jgi:hypothetical protein
MRPYMASAGIFCLRQVVPDRSRWQSPIVAAPLRRARRSIAAVAPVATEPRREAVAVETPLSRTERRATQLAERKLMKKQMKAQPKTPPQSGAG